MRCSRARDLIALQAGGDLPEIELPAMQAHIRDCPDCAKELSSFKRMFGTVRTIAELDTPDPLPSDFVDRVLTVARERQQARPALLKFPRRLVAVGAIAAAAAAFVLWIGLNERGGSSVVSIDDARFAGSEPVQQPTAISWAELQMQYPECLQGPYPLDARHLPDEAGVFAIMHKPDPEGRPDTFVIDFCRRGKQLSAYGGYPWMEQRKRRLVARAGSEQNLYIAVCLMPGSQPSDRRRIERDLIESFEPFFNQPRGL